MRSALAERERETPSMSTSSMQQAGFRPTGGRALGAAALAIAALVALGGCAGSHQRGSIRVEELPPSQPPDPEYHVDAGDVLSVRVWNQESMSQARARVRDDGRISVPFLQDVQVVGETPTALSRRLQAELAGYIVNPRVTVTLEERRPLRVSVVGEVTRPGIYELERGSGVLGALAAAGGLTPYSDGDAVYVLRPAAKAPVRIRFRFGALTRAEVPASSFVLAQGDTVVVE
jgi:polysaccharide biosynthesis/export protein